MFCQVIPIAPCPQGDESNEKTSNPYAFVSIEDTSKPDDQPKALRGQIRLFNLIKLRLVGGPLAEVRSFSYIYFFYMLNIARIFPFLKFFP